MMPEKSFAALQPLRAEMPIARNQHARLVSEGLLDILAHLPSERPQLALDHALDPAVKGMQGTGGARRDDGVCCHAGTQRPAVMKP